MKNAFHGKVLWVDLTAKSCRVLKLSEDYYKNFIGGSGLAIRLIYERQPAGLHPFDRQSIIGFVPGLLSGTDALFSGRYMAVGKSPATGGWAESNAGGFISTEIKKAGLDGIFVQGIADRPVYLFIKGKKADIRPADHLWGKDTIETENTLKAELNDPGLRVACIGPAGEKLSYISGIVSDGGRVAARGGLGALMGSKQLKALAVSGRGKVTVFDKPSILNINKKMLSLRRPIKKINSAKLSSLILKSSPILRQALAAAQNASTAPLLGLLAERLFVPLTRFNAMILPLFARTAAWQLFSRYGTSSLTVLLAEIGDAPVKNWKGQIGKELSSAALRDLAPDRFSQHEKKRFHCHKCPLGCGAIVEIPYGKYKGQSAHRPEYESISALGPLCLNHNLESIFHLNELCNRAGLDTISAGSVMAFAIECFEEGLITQADTGGLRLKWGDAKCLEQLLVKIINRHDIGDLLADGVKKAADKLGQGSYSLAMHAGGMELPMHHPLAVSSFSAAYATEPATGRHTNSSIPYALTMDLMKLYPDIFSGPIFTLSNEKTDVFKARCQATAGYYIQVINAAGLCLSGALMGGLPQREWINAATGWELTHKDILTIGQRILTLKQAFNLREGLRLSEIRLPRRVLGRQKGSADPLSNKKNDLDRQRRAYCKELGWHPVSGKPSYQILEKLDLTPIVQNSEKRK